MFSDEIFERCHSSLNFEKDLKIITDKEIISFLEERNLDERDFFEVKNALAKYCYLNRKNGAYIEIFSFTEDLFNCIQVIERIKVTNEYLNNAIKNKDYNNVFSILDKKVRIHFLNEWFKDIPKEKVVDIFDFVYSSSEYNFNLIDKEVFQYVKKFNADKLKSLPEVVEIYRGQTNQSENYDKAYSWTLKENTAKFFATRFKSDGIVLKAKINRKDIVTYITTRNEEEIVVIPDKVFDIKII